VPACSTRLLYMCLLAALASITRPLCLLAMYLWSLLAVMHLLAVFNYLLYLLAVHGWCASVLECFLPCHGACVLVYGVYIQCLGVA